MNPRRLYRCRRDRQLAGVAAGMAEYFDLDPTVVRILWILGAAGDLAGLLSACTRGWRHAPRGAGAVP